MDARAGGYAPNLTHRRQGKASYGNRRNGDLFRRESGKATIQGQPWEEGCVRPVRRIFPWRREGSVGKNLRQ